MADEDIKEDIGTVPETPVVVHAQYLKDLSFENPNAPEALSPSNAKPEIDINISVDPRRKEHPELKDFFEVTLIIEAHAKRDDKTMFLTELKYCAAVSLHDVEEARHHPILFVEVPRTLFPFARMVLANSTQWGGFTPLQLAMVDFRAMYFKRFGDQVNQNKDKAL